MTFQPMANIQNIYSSLFAFGSPTKNIFELVLFNGFRLNKQQTRYEKLINVSNDLNVKMNFWTFAGITPFQTLTDFEKSFNRSVNEALKQQREKGNTIQVCDEEFVNTINKILRDKGVWGMFASC